MPSPQLLLRLLLYSEVGAERSNSRWQKKAFLDFSVWPRCKENPPLLLSLFSQQEELCCCFLLKSAAAAASAAAALSFPPRRTRCCRICRPFSPPPPSWVPPPPPRTKSRSLVPPPPPSPATINSGRRRTKERSCQFRLHLPSPNTIRFAQKFTWVIFAQISQYLSLTTNIQLLGIHPNHTLTLKKRRYQFHLCPNSIIFTQIFTCAQIHPNIQYIWPNKSMLSLRYLIEPAAEQQPLF